MLTKTKSLASTRFTELYIDARNKNKISYGKLSKLTGISRSNLFRYKKGIQPTLNNADKVLSVLGVKMWIGDDKK